MDELAMTLQKQNEKLSQSLAEWADYVVSAFSNSLELLKEVRRILSMFDSWERRDDEGLIEWGDRLQEGGWLDTPEARVAYQREVWGAVASPVVWMWRKFRRD